MKNRPFLARLGFAVSGIRGAWATEASFRAQVVMGCGALALLIVLRPAPVWWALVLLITGAVLACELINTALERIIDLLHPETHPMIAIAKDCAAGAVLVLSLSAVAVLVCLLAGYVSG
jgi:undecaprenol kinase